MTTRAVEPKRAAHYALRAHGMSSVTRFIGRIPLQERRILWAAMYVAWTVTNLPVLGLAVHDYMANREHPELANVSDPAIGLLFWALTPFMIVAILVAVVLALANVAIGPWRAWLCVAFTIVMSALVIMLDNFVLSHSHVALIWSVGLMAIYVLLPVAAAVVTDRIVRRCYSQRNS